MGMFPFCRIRSCRLWASDREGFFSAFFFLDPMINDQILLRLKEGKYIR